MKQCCFCRRDLPSGSSAQCDTCKKNEEKYGKPEICMYCQLPAAFKEKKCVHCAYNERKHGSPRNCQNCGLKSAFIRDPNKLPKRILCRLCQPIHGQSSSSSLKPKRTSIADGEPSSSKRSKNDPHRHPNSSSHHPPPDAAAQTSSASNFMSNIEIETSAKVQAYKERINELSTVVSKRDQQIKELQQRIVELESDQLRKEKESRQKLLNLEKQNDTTVSNLQDQLRQLNKELANKRLKH